MDSIVYEINYFDNKWEIEREVTKGGITRLDFVKDKTLVNLAKGILREYQWPLDSNFIIRYYADIEQGVAVRLNNGQFRRFWNNTKGEHHE